MRVLLDGGVDWFLLVVFESQAELPGVERLPVTVL